MAAASASSVAVKIPQPNPNLTTSSTQTVSKQPTGGIKWLLANEKELALCFVIFSTMLLILSAGFGIAGAKSDPLLSKIDQVTLLAVKSVGLIGLITSLYLAILKKDNEKKM
jgi:hypothetical protein